jgi:hypothetical protein
MRDGEESGDCFRHRLRNDGIARFQNEGRHRHYVMAATQAVIAGRLIAAVGAGIRGDTHRGSVTSIHLGACHQKEEHGDNADCDATQH